MTEFNVSLDGQPDWLLPPPDCGTPEVLNPPSPLTRARRAAYWALEQHQKAAFFNPTYATDRALLQRKRQDLAWLEQGMVPVDLHDAIALTAGEEKLHGEIQEAQENLKLALEQESLAQSVDTLETDKASATAAFRAESEKIQTALQAADNLLIQLKNESDQKSLAIYPAQQAIDSAKKNPTQTNLQAAYDILSTLGDPGIVEQNAPSFMGLQTKRSPEFLQQQQLVKAEAAKLMEAMTAAKKFHTQAQKLGRKLEEAKRNPPEGELEALKQAVKDAAAVLGEKLDALEQSLADLPAVTADDSEHLALFEEVNACAKRGTGFTLITLGALGLLGVAVAARLDKLSQPLTNLANRVGALPFYTVAATPALAALVTRLVLRAKENRLAEEGVAKLFTYRQLHAIALTGKAVPDETFRTWAVEEEGMPAAVTRQLNALFPAKED